ncbi:shikimate kinase [Brachybacterium endophyticum]|uniref:Shikimate kinase n=1 Tax=Brachybacterium endophyticum TaxID=2182385 RepID=A0A2U2RJ75_9MICO|nr:shikimate kinase [Brachybacterium endophyticum]
MHGPRLVLIGPMGAGKTTVGREVARRLGVPFADLDALIVDRDGRSIPEIFAADGEEAFRRLEARVLAHALATHAGVLALGGGAVGDPASRALVASHPTVLLEIDESAALRRVHAGRGRPMLAGEDPLERWRTLTAERLPLYREAARWSIEASRGDVPAVARRVIAAVRETERDHEPGTTIDQVGAAAPGTKEDA